MQHFLVSLKITKFPFRFQSLPEGGAVSIRLIAKDLYRLMAEVEELEQRFDAAPADAKPSLEDALRKKRAERDRLRKALDGQKD